jgi:glycerol-3-phosphate O-acyltransferase
MYIIILLIFRTYIVLLVSRHLNIHYSVEMMEC